MSIVIVINGVDAKGGKGGHGHGGDHDRGGGHSDGHGGDDNGDDNGHDNGDDGNGGGNGNGNGGGKSRGGERGGGGECASVDGVNPCIVARPKIDRGPTEIAPGVFQYYGAFGQVIGTAIITLDEPQLELDLVTSSPDLAPKIIETMIANPQPVAIVKKASQDHKLENATPIRKRTILPPEKSADPILDILIIQAIERPVIEPVQSVPTCDCSAQ